MSAIVEKINLTGELEARFLAGGRTTSISRKKAFDAFVAGLPGNKSEEYKFTPITRVLEKIFNKGSHSAPFSTNLIPDLKSNVVVFVNGEWSKEKTIILDDDLKLELVEDIPADGTDPFIHLNTAFHNHSVQLSVGENKNLLYPISIIYCFDSSEFVFANPRWTLSLSEGSGASVVEYIAANGSTYFNNKYSKIEVSDRAALEYIVIQNGQATDVQLNNSFVIGEASSKISTFHYTFGGQLIRNNLTMVIDGENIDAHLHGLYLISNNTLADNHTVVDHRKANSYSNELYKGVMGGNSKGVFNGKIYVRPHAQKTNAFQSNRNILLGDAASVNTKPQLEIWADDVKCSHGCTTGQLDEEALFYLQSRGIRKETARGMLLQAFAAETVAPINNALVRTYLENLITEKLAVSF